MGLGLVPISVLSGAATSDVLQGNSPDDLHHKELALEDMAIHKY